MCEQRNRIVVILIVAILCIVIGVMCCIFIKPNSKEMALTDTEEKYVGRWVLDDITITSYYQVGNSVGNSFEQRYPSNYSNEYAVSHNVFNQLCEKYFGKTELVFGNTKNDGKKDMLLKGEFAGSLIIDNNATQFYWYVSDNNFSINLTNLKLSNIYGKTEIRDIGVFTASINSRNHLIMSLTSNVHSSNEPVNTIMFVFNKS